MYGGWYVDLTLKMLTSIRVADHIDMIVFADRGCISMCQPWAIQNGLIYSKPGNPIFLRLINRIAAHRSNQYYGSSPLCPTGPNCFGMEVAAEEISMNIVKGTFQPLTPTLSFNNLMYVAQSGQLIAQHRTSWMTGSQGGDFSVTQLPGVNNYKKLWETASDLLLSILASCLNHLHPRCNHLFDYGVPSLHLEVAGMRRTLSYQARLRFPPIPSAILGSTAGRANWGFPWRLQDELLRCPN